MNEKERVLNFYHELQILKNKYNIYMRSQSRYEDDSWIELIDRNSRLITATIDSWNELELKDN